MLILGLVGIAALNLLSRSSVTPTPPVIAGLAPTQIIVEGTPATNAVRATPTIPPVVTLPPTPTIEPTATPIPVLPTTLQPGVFARVINTEGAGVSMRAGPGTNNARLDTIPEGTIVEIESGPRDSEGGLDDFIWWFVKTPNSAAEFNQGWVVSEFLEPSLPPGNN